ncbi:7835_t:CDS:2, partial [Funneliformis caledonium]
MSTELYLGGPSIFWSPRKKKRVSDVKVDEEQVETLGECPQEERDQLNNQRAEAENFPGDQKKNKTSEKMKDSEEEDKCSSILFDEKNEDSLIESIDESGLISEIKLPISKPSENIFEYKLSSGDDLLTMFKNIKKVSQSATELLLDARNFQKDIWELSQDFSNTISWDPKSAPNYLQEYFNKNCEESHQIKNIKKLHMNIQFIKENMYSLNDSMTEEELKMISIFPLFCSILQLNVVKNAWGEIQGTLKNTPNKFKALFSEVSGGITSLGISSSS